MTALRLLPGGDDEPRSQYENAVALLLSTAGIWSHERIEKLTRWVEAQPDPDRALGRLVRDATDPVTLARLTAWSEPTPPTRPASEPAPAPSPQPVVRSIAGVSIVAVGSAAEIRPVADPEGLSAQRRGVARAALWVRNIGVIMLLLLAYQWWGTGFQQRRAQAALRTEAASGGSTGSGSDGATVTPPPSSASGRAPLLLLPGGVVAEITIPSIGVDQFVVEGTGEDSLQRGPGHYVGTPLPGQHGNAAIAGHRTTYGAPFNRLGDVRPGDSIIARTATGTYLYTAAATQVVSPSQTSVVDDYGDDRLTLTTCTPEFTATHRLILIAALQGPVVAPPPVRAAPPPAISTHLVGVNHEAISHLGAEARAFDLAALPAAFAIVAALVGLALLYRPVRRRLPVLAASSVLAPLWLCGLLVLLQQLNRFLPPNV